MSDEFRLLLDATIDKVLAEENAQLQVATDAVLQAGWRPERLHIYVRNDGPHVCELVITAGYCLGTALVVFEVRRETKDNAIVITSRWCAPIPSYVPAPRGHGHESLRWLDLDVARATLRVTDSGVLDWGEWVQRRVPECCRDVVEGIIGEVFEQFRGQIHRMWVVDTFIDRVLQRLHWHLDGRDTYG